MSNKIAVKIIFYTLVVAAAFAGGMLYFKTTAIAPTPPTSEANVPLANVPATKTCVITVDEKRYDVQPLRGTHPGGDIFKCDTDMSSIFHGQHGESVKRIEKYLIK